MPSPVLRSFPSSATLSLLFVSFLCLSQYQSTMFSLVKVSLLAFLSFATLALATPTLDGRSKDPMAAISTANVALQKAVLPLGLCYFPSIETLLVTHTCCPRIVHVTRDNRTSDCIDPVVEEVIEIVEVLVSSLKGSSLSGCDCTAKEIYELIAITLKVLIIPPYSSYAHVPMRQTILEPLGPVVGSSSDLGGLLNRLV